MVNTPRPRQGKILSSHLITTVFVLTNTIIGLYSLLSLQLKSETF